MYCNVSLSTAFCAKKVPTSEIKAIGKNIEKKAEYISPFAPTGAVIDPKKLASSPVNNTLIPYNVLEEKARQEAKIASEKAAKLAAEEAKNIYPPVPFN